MEIMETVFDYDSSIFVSTYSEKKCEKDAFFKGVTWRKKSRTVNMWCWTRSRRASWEGLPGHRCGARRQAGRVLGGLRRVQRAPAEERQRLG
jgi:hypothetical protein